MTVTPLIPTRGTIVVVEDDIDLLHAIQFSLELEGWEVAAYSTAEALLAGEALPKTGCLVIDQILPGASGLDLLAKLRLEGIDLPAIIITTNPGAQIRQRAVESKARIVEKPLLGGTLIEAIQQMLTGKSAS